MSSIEQNNHFEIELPQFKGPFDLLLFFIQRDELNIYDIPIFKITTDFLSYIHQMKQLNIELASEFILVAATLMKIKAQLLLPRKIVDEEGNELDPRKELVQKILEYKQFKELSLKLEELEADRLLKIRRLGANAEIGAIAELYKTELELEELSLIKLLKVFEKLLVKKNLQSQVIHHEINFIKYSIEDEKNAILSKLNLNEKIDFEKLFETINSRLHAIYHFLAMLELIQEEKICIIFGDGKNNFWISIQNDSK